MSDPAPNNNEGPHWRNTLRSYLTPKQQALFNECYDYLFERDHSREILWALVNVFGLLTVVLHKLVTHLAELLEATAKLHQATLDLEYSIRMGTDSMKDAALKAHEASHELRKSTVPWDKAVLMIFMIFAAALASGMIVFAVMCFHDRLQQPSLDWKPLPVQSDVGHS